VNPYSNLRETISAAKPSLHVDVYYRNHLKALDKIDYILEIIYMNSSKKFHILTFEIDTTTKEIEIHANKEGLEILRKKIDFLLNSKSADHSHLMTEAWGGSELTNQKQSEQNELIHSVKIFKWD
jgi:hypothetical protein